MNTSPEDPTAVPVGGTDERLTGVTAHGNMPFDVPLQTHVMGRLWMGGSGDHNPRLPSNFVHVINLYPWGGYRSRPGILTFTMVKMYDSLDQSFNLVQGLVDWIDTLLLEDNGDVLVHCQIGLNRSSLIVGEYLKKHEDMDGQDIIDMLRMARSPAVLCNPAFEAQVRKPQEPTVTEYVPHPIDTS